MLNDAAMDSSLINERFMRVSGYSGTAFCFDYRAHLLCHCFDNLMQSQHLFPSRVAFIFGQNFVLMTGELNRSFSLFQHTPKSFNGVKVRTVVANSCVKITPHAPLFHNWGSMNLGIVVLDYARTIREEKNPLMREPGHSVHSGTLLTCCA